MSKHYRGRRSRNLYKPDDTKPFKLSRSRLELFAKCLRCFYIDSRLGLDRLPGFPFSLNNAVDSLLKAEFDHFRLLGKRHPLQVQFELPRRPATVDKLDAW